MARHREHDLAKTGDVGRQTGAIGRWPDKETNCCRVELPRHFWKLVLRPRRTAAGPAARRGLDEALFCTRKDNRAEAREVKQVFME
jgi:hypothetical protein